MIVSTMLNLFLIPILYVIVRSLIPMPKSRNARAGSRRVKQGSSAKSSAARVEAALTKKAGISAGQAPYMGGYCMRTLRLRCCNSDGGSPNLARNKLENVGAL